MNKKELLELEDFSNFDYDKEIQERTDKVCFVQFILAILVFIAVGLLWVHFTGLQIVL